MLNKFRTLISEYFHARRDKGFLYVHPRLYNLLRGLNHIKLIPKGYFSQAGQDLIAESLLKLLNPEMKNIKIIDIGANHPIIINNSLYFERKFNSIVESIEPNPQFYNIYLKENRKIHQFAVGSVEKELELLIPQRKLINLQYDDSVHATFVHDELPEIGVEFLKTKCLVKTLDKIVEVGRYNILFIDVEGYELEVLKGIDFKKFKFDIIVIENNSKNVNLSVIYSELNKNGYSLYGRIYKLDDIYVNNDIKSLLG